MDYTDLHFNNIQLMKLVSSADIIFRHLYSLVSVENKTFIDQWFCFKQEFDETCHGQNNDHFDVNENVRESPVLARIDEVSENEKISSTSSVSTTSLDSSISLENVKEKNVPSVVSKFSSPSSETIAEKEDNQMSKIDSDLLEYMSQFKLFSDVFVSDWFKTFSFSTSEVREYIKWLENKDYKRIWANIYNNSRRNCELNDNYSAHEKQFSHNTHQVEKMFIPMETSHNQRKPAAENINLRKSDLSGASTDEQIRHLHKTRNILLQLREQINNKLKKDEIKSSVDIKYELKIHVAFEIIDISIEMKNQLKLGRVIQDLNCFNDKVDTVIADCLCALSKKEMRYLLMTYLSNIIDMRKTCSEYDKQLLQLDSDLSNQKFLIWRMYMIINENKRVYQSQCLTLHKQFEQKLHLMSKTTTDESNDESVVGLEGQKLLSIVEKNDLQNPPHSHLKGTKNLQNAIACASNIPQKSWKTLQNTSASSGTKVTLKKKKLIIQTQKH